MMLFVGILTIYFTGASLLLRFGKNFSWKEMISFSFLLGIAAETFFMFLCDVTGFGFTRLVLFFASFAVIVFNYDLLIEYYQQKRKDIRLPSLSPSTMNYTAALLFGVILFLFYIITQKNLYWPTSEHDAIASFDKLGMVMAMEGKIKISLFQWNLQGSGGIYPPLFHGGIAYMYLFGAESPKIITTLFYVSLLLGFYAICKKYVSAINALFFTLLLEIVPELYAHAALLLGNLPTTANVAMAALTLFVALDKKDKNYLWLSAVLTSVALWTRNDIIGFAVAALLIVTIHYAKQKEWKTIALYAMVAFSSIIIWTLYLKFKIDIPQTSRFSGGFGSGLGGRLDTMLLYLIAMLTWLQHGKMPPGHMLYGLAFMLPMVIILLNAKNIKSDKPFVLLYTFVAFAIYFTVFLVINEKAQGAPISELMESSFKRGMFCFIPLLLFYASTCKFSQAIFGWIERFRNGE